jgi:DNA-binding MarR family transcriptional regulator
MANQRNVSSKSGPSSDAAAELRTTLQQFFQIAATLAMQTTSSMGLKSSDIRALQILDTVSAERATIGQLAEKLDLAPQSTTELVDRLEKAEMLTRSRDTADRRRVFLELTAKAKRVGNESLRPLLNAIDETINVTSDADLAAANHFIRELINQTQRHA